MFSSTPPVWDPSKEALLAFIRDTTTVPNEISEQDRIDAPKLVSYLRDPSFWLDLDALHDISKPISERQHKSEADRAHVGHVLAGWGSIQQVWQTLQASGPQYQNVDWDL